MRRTTSVSTPIAHLVGPGKLKVINGRLAFSAKDESPVRLDPSKLEEICCYGPVGITDDAFQMLFRYEIPVAWLSLAGQNCRGRLVRSDASRTSLRLLQYQAFLDLQWRTQWAAQVVGAKITSQIEAARYFQRKSTPDATDILRQLESGFQRCSQNPTIEQLRGIEGAASAAWFRLFGTALNDPWKFTQRTRRPPRDPVNAMLSLGYTWLHTRTLARVEAQGLEPYLGGLHEYRAGRPSLVCDLVEPLRVPTVDRWVLRLCNRKGVTPEDFVPKDGGFRLTPQAFPNILQRWEEYWHDQHHDLTLSQIIDSLKGQLRQRKNSFPEVSTDEAQDDSEAL
ncbi:MAG: CRISPR-associated endonuclease Cas1 [Gemmataceae bacterium]